MPSPFPFLAATAIAAATVATAAPAAPAALTPEAADARCVVIFGFISRQPGQPADRMEAIKTGTAYYLGKLSGRHPGLNLTQTLGAAANRAQAEKVDVVKESQRCGRELTALAAATRPAGGAPAPAKR